MLLVTRSYFIGRTAFPAVNATSLDSATRVSPKVFFEIHGCQMNSSDAEVAWSVLRSAGYEKVDNPAQASAVLILTCAIRDSAEQKIWDRLEFYKRLRKRAVKGGLVAPKIGLLGCMAERLKEKIIDREQLVDLVAGPDSYRDLPQLLEKTASGQSAVNVLLSKEETYADILPVQLTDSSCTAFVSIQRGCDNFCSFCIVPFVRGKERSRPIRSLIEEVKSLAARGIREVTLLGQNVNSYRDLSETVAVTYRDLSETVAVTYRDLSETVTVGISPQQGTPATGNSARGFRSIYKPKVGGLRFVDLLERISDIDPELRIRFQSPHPKDFPDEVLHLIRERPSICKQIHLPAQSGSTSVLKAMRRGYTREAYLDLVHQIRSIIPDVAFTSDFIAGFCGETEDDHKETLQLLREVKYGVIFAFPYSMRENTSAQKRLADDVPQEVKNRRFQELTATFRELALTINKGRIGTRQLVLVEGDSKRSAEFMQGRADCGTKVIFPKVSPANQTEERRSPKPGEYWEVEIHDASSQVLHGTVVRLSSVRQFTAMPAHSALRTAHCV
ncbi:CDK5 regulatory subunit-associated protein 1 [Hypsibius exemplaris]|uniref:CDK5RAP1-like protein n=1 Tax=Hypsibius exemplaris TaxID=2072580 RepID=A0A1W0WW49_HYPEX|nr:CDK5 regulatory subunit-associated protein 1 [Hypsibius exemplaris]